MTRKAAAAFFIQALAELSQGGAVPGMAVRALASLKGMPKPVRAAASEISAMLMSGYRFSSALAACTTADFSEGDIALVRSAEETGNFAQAFRFLAAAKKRKQQAISRLAVSAVYPCFVALLVVAGSAAILFCARMLLPLSAGTLDSAAYRAGVRLGIAGAAAFLAAVIAAFLYAAKKLLDAPALSTAFLLLDFLCSAGIDLSRAVRSVISGISDDPQGGGRAGRKLAAALAQTLENLQNGLPLTAAFAPVSDLSPPIRYQLELAALGGRSGAVFSHIAAALAERDEKRRTVFVQIAEPMMLLAAGLYMLIILQTAVMPLITNYGGLL
jgi:type II secretory pathway component PulF